MCTVTWTRTEGGYVLFSNRDESDTRQRALGPRVSELRRVTYVAPVDADHGGSWIGVNEFGLSLCLLNRYGDISVASGGNFISRGLLLTDLMDCQSTTSVRERVDQPALKRYRPFILLALATVAPTLILHWNGHEVLVEEDAELRVPLTSTSVQEPGIASERLKQFDLMTRGASVDRFVLDRFHRSHLPDRGPYSVCMHREGARTVSVSEISVSKNRIQFSYHAGSPCEESIAQEVTLKKRRRI